MAELQTGKRRIARPTNAENAQLGQVRLIISVLIISSAMTYPTTPRPSPLPAGIPDEDLLLLLHDVARLTRIETDRRARQHGMTRAQWVMLLKLARHPGLSQKDLAEILEVEPMSVARLTDRLEHRGLVERRADPNDRRIWRLHLCPEAENLLDMVKAERVAIADLVMRDLPAPMLATMIDGLGRIKSALAETARPSHESAPDPQANTDNIQNRNSAREIA